MTVMCSQVRQCKPYKPSFAEHTRLSDAALETRSLKSPSASTADTAKAGSQPQVTAVILKRGLQIKVQYMTCRYVWHMPP